MPEESAMVPEGYRELMESDRVSVPTREVLEKRLAGPKATEVLTETQRVTLQALCARVVPQAMGIDVAGTIAARLASGKGDGWRYAVLGEDLEAYRGGLDRLAAQGFGGMSEAEQDEAIAMMGVVKGSAEARWFEEVRGDAVTAYISHPAAYARIGYSGIGVGGARTVHQGFVGIAMGEVEAWEPKPEGGQA
jgi:hypothetical protein